jgi:hypothetical protein
VSGGERSQKEECELLSSLLALAGREYVLGLAAEFLSSKTKSK